MYDLNFYLKWCATIILIIGTAFNSIGYYPLGPIILVVGGILWLIVSIRWKEPSLILTNGVMTLVAIVGLVYGIYYIDLC
jgi:hypothetical protein